MDIQFLESYQLSSEIPKLINKADEVLIAVAYVKKSGLKQLLPSIEELIKRNGSLKIIFGLSHIYGITDKESAKILLELSQVPDVEIHKCNNKRFHPKLFIFKGEKTSILIGSSNLTKGAQTSNVEANVLIKNPKIEFRRRVEKFFDSYFSITPILTKKDVKKYNPYINKPKISNKKRPPEDTLPTILPEIEWDDKIPRSIWKIAPGRDAMYWYEWCNEIDENDKGFIAIGWDIGNLEKMSKKEMKRKIHLNAVNKWNVGREKKVNEGYVLNQLWNFKNSIIKRDIVVVYSECRVFAITEVLEIDNYCYKYNDYITYPHQIIVKYLWYQDWPTRAPQGIIRELGKRGTLRKIEENNTWNLIRKTYFR
jgi:HKD family nuclease